MGYPVKEKALQLLAEAEERNPGPWGDHSRTAAMCAGKIAAACGMDAEKAWSLGLLHDIGRRFGITHLAHVWDGYRYLMELGYPNAARVCLTHSFCRGDFSGYVGRYDLPEEEQDRLKALLEQTAQDDYDRLIQLCDCLAGNGKVVDMEARMEDVCRRYGYYPEEKREVYRRLRRYFEEKCGKDIYEVCK